MNQADIILQQLVEKRTVSMLTAVHQRIGNLRDVILQLRNRGYVISTVSDSDGRGVPFTKYVLGQGGRIVGTRRAA